MKEITRCPICGRQGLLRSAEKVAFSAPIVNTEIGLDGAKREDAVHLMMAAMVQYSLCLSCGVYIQNPRMEDGDIQKYYVVGMYRTWLNLSQEDLDKDELARAKMDAALIRKTLYPEPTQIESHLDVGASRGYLLDEIGARYKVAVEPNIDYITRHPHHEYAILGDIPVHERFSLVTAIHSLEHTTDPLGVMQAMAHRVRTGGYLVIEVPSEQSPGGWARLAHTFHFPPWTLIRMADGMGWKLKFYAVTPHSFFIFERMAK